MTALLRNITPAHVRRAALVTDSGRNHYDIVDGADTLRPHTYYDMAQMAAVFGTLQGDIEPSPLAQPYSWDFKAGQGQDYDRCVVMVAFVRDVPQPSGEIYKYRYILSMYDVGKPGLYECHAQEANEWSPHHWNAWTVEQDDVHALVAASLECRIPRTLNERLRAAWAAFVA